MGSVRVRQDTGALFLDFIYMEKRFREQTALQDTPINRKRLERRLARIEAQIAAGTFDYDKTFGNSKARPAPQRAASPPTPMLARSESERNSVRVPTFFEFGTQWLSENEVQWRRSYRITQRGAFDKYLNPHFGSKFISQIVKADILAFRSELSKLPGRLGPALSARRINAVMKPLRQILNEAADRYNFSSPFRNIKPLKMKRSEVMPFSLDQVQILLAAVRDDYRDYLTVRFFTGMRSGEVHALKWNNVDFARRLIFVRESLSLGEDDELKTAGSHRDIHMSQVVQDALKRQHTLATNSAYVFTNTIGGPVDNKNFVNRVWSPLLDKLGLIRRRPYQMRHSAATFWLASGESPEWIARQLGHTTTEMLFRVYSRYVPNLTRQDGTAMDRLLLSAFAPGVPGASSTALFESRGSADVR
jgi:integrase